MLKLPLRGSIGVGPAILDKSNGTYLGLPLVDAARLEKRQRWLGVSFCDSFLRPPYNVIYPDSVIPYSEHFKEEADRRKPCLVLDWPRSWRDQKLGDIEAVISELNKDRDHEAYYANTLKFVAHSEQNQDWFRHLEVREPRPSPQQAP